MPARLFSTSNTIPISYSSVNPTPVPYPTLSFLAVIGHQVLIFLLLLCIRLVLVYLQTCPLLSFPFRSKLLVLSPTLSYPMLVHSVPSPSKSVLPTPPQLHCDSRTARIFFCERISLWTFHQLRRVWSSAFGRQALTVRPSCVHDLFLDAVKFANCE